MHMLFLHMNDLNTFEPEDVQMFAYISVYFVIFFLCLCPSQVTCRILGLALIRRCLHFVCNVSYLWAAFQVTVKINHALFHY